MKIIKNILIIFLYIGLFSSLTLYIMDLLIFLQLNENVANNIGRQIKLALNISLVIMILTYLILLVISYYEICRENKLNKREANFWKKILVLKPISGVTAYHFCMYKKNVNSNISSFIRFSYFLRKISFFLVILSIIALFLLHKPNPIILSFVIIGIYFSITMYLIFEPLILIDAWFKDREEWEKHNYYDYFTSIKSIIGYGEYYRNQFRK